jgi:hypothetical protein
MRLLLGTQPQMRGAFCCRPTGAKRIGAHEADAEAANEFQPLRYAELQRFFSRCLPTSRASPQGGVSRNTI